ncbi:MAG: n-acetylglutamate synthase [Acidobacteria bacterium]|nr:n-acetylglutamate synthase [Acidobacteriota bacterium]
MIDYNGKTFRPVGSTENGETSAATVFHYKQDGAILTAEYAGGKIRLGHLLGLVDDAGNIEMHYHQINERGEMMTGVCRSVPEILPNGKIRLHESWTWTSGDRSSGRSTLEEE